MIAQLLTAVGMMALGFYVMIGLGQVEVGVLVCLASLVSAFIAPMKRKKR